jgi:hypothetical protein
MAEVPGTVLLNDSAASPDNEQHGLRRVDGNTVLSPQPSDDVNDPLNWPGWKKELNIIILCLGAMLNAGTNVCHSLLKRNWRLSN